MKKLLIGLTFLISVSSFADQVERCRSLLGRYESTYLEIKYFTGKGGITKWDALNKADKKCRKNNFLSCSFSDSGRTLFDAPYVELKGYKVKNEDFFNPLKIEKRCKTLRLCVGSFPFGESRTGSSYTYQSLRDSLSGIYYDVLQCSDLSSEPQGDIETIGDYSGIIRSYNETEGFGFILVGDGEVFFRNSNSFKQGDLVNFDILGGVATKVKLN